MSFDEDFSPPPPRSGSVRNEDGKFIPTRKEETTRAKEKLLDEKRRET